MSDGDKVKAEIDRRKLDRLVKDEVVSAEDLINAKIVFHCSCGQEQDVENTVCIKCGADIS